MARAKPKKDAVVQIRVEDARTLLTVGPENDDWKRVGELVGNWHVKGWIVRLRPPASASDADVDRMRSLYEKAGVERVTVLPRPRAEVVPTASREKQSPKAIGARDAVRQLVEESNAKDREALWKYCDRKMMEAGL